MSKTSSSSPYEIVLQCLRQRRSVGMFDPTGTIPASEIAALITCATSAPSAFNAQNWMFYVASSDAAKQTLAAHAYHQPQITQAAHTLIICGTTPPQDYVAHGLQAAHDSGIMPEEIAKNWVSMAEGMYANQPQLQRDEAIRSASLAAMCLMLAAEAKGYATCPMIGFDPKAVHQSFAIPEHHIPVMLLPIGYAAAQAWPQKPRHPAAAVMKTL